MPPSLPQPSPADHHDDSSPRGPQPSTGPRRAPETLHALFRTFDDGPEQVLELGSGTAAPGARFHVVGADEVLVGRRFVNLDSELGTSEPFFLVVEGDAGDRRLAMWRNALWPLVHVGAILRVKDGRATRMTLSGSTKLDGVLQDAAIDWEGAVLFGRRRAHVMSPQATAEKFDANASGWNGVPGGPGYPHFRWMRRYVGHFGGALNPATESDEPIRILDFGCGAGWVGIEAARIQKRPVHLAAFDPSPEMVKIAAQNAKEHGIEDFDGRVGFGEDPPFGGDRSAPFDLVLSSGVVSFSPDVERWLDGLVATLRPGGDLVVGDIHPHSKGFVRRRTRKPLLPVREMNARAREEIREGLERRGLSHLRSGAYQLSRPVPEAMHVNETKLKGLLTHPLLIANRIATRLDASFGSPLQDRFDSWVMHLHAPE